MRTRKPALEIQKARERKKTRENQRRIARQHARKVQEKKPLVEPLTIASTEERNAAAKQGKLVFFDRGKRVEVPLMLNYSFLGKASLQGVYKRHNGDIVTLRAFPSDLEREAFIGFFRLVGHVEKPVTNNFGELSYAWRERDLGHMELIAQMQGEGLGLKAVSRAERERRALNRGEHMFFCGKKFRGLFKKLGYQELGSQVSKPGKFNPKDYLSKWHAIEAIDPKNGKARMFYFKIGGKE